MKLYKEMINGEHITAEKQEGVVFHSDLVEATEEEIAKAREEYAKTKKCTHHFIYDEDCWVHYARYCGICKEFICMI